MDIQQGNYLDQAQVAKLRPGMTHAQVRFLLGTPLVVDPFHSDRWDYLYVDQQRGRLTDYRRLTLHFDGDKLVRAQTDLPLDKPAQKQVAAPPSR
jgi:outer membrane protein assembly factor BamE